MVHNLSEQNSIANHFLMELRDKSVQQDRMRFRKNMERLGEVMAFEISKQLHYVEKIVETPLGKTAINILAQQPVLITVLRAGLAYYNGFAIFFDRAESGFIGAYRKEGGEEITINLEYLASPSLEGKDVVLIDPMLATGQSFIESVNALMKHGKPARIFVAAVVAAPEGLRYIKENMKIPFSIWTCAVDECLNDQFYIMPGLGDAGDLSFGDKL